MFLAEEGAKFSVRGCGKGQWSLVAGTRPPPMYTTSIAPMNKSLLQEAVSKPHPNCGQKKSQH